VEKDGDGVYAVAHLEPGYLRAQLPNAGAAVCVCAALPSSEFTPVGRAWGLRDTACPLHIARLGSLSARRGRLIRASGIGRGVVA
jgi:hypothetical protein